MARGFAAAGLVVFIAAVPVRAAPDAQAGVRYLGSNPIGPLAVARGGILKAPGDRACRSWGPVGSRWRELDVFGRIAGDVTIKRREYYEVSRCDELEVRRVNGRKGAGVFVDARATYRAPRVESWQPGADAMSALESVARDHQRAIKNVNPALHVPFAKRVLFFEWSATGERYAVVGGPSLIVLTSKAGRWEIAYEQEPEKMRSQDEGYKPLVITDMNADGRPEIVVHHQEEAGEWYGDFTLSLQANGKWQEVGAGIFGSTA
ncbi:MAG TPA: hypothetical protein VN903_31255 [Polyangia bacterium]|jgi:hypothetical protein|nr:hypothetical protein [Polyangia bacterium]